MKTLLTLIALLLSFGVTYADYDRLRESLQPVADCQATEGAIGVGNVRINMLCPTHDENWLLIRVEKKVFINLYLKTWTRENWRFTLLD